MSHSRRDEEDMGRLPEGFKRIAYDADTARYTFCDREGNEYLGPPHEEYGQLIRVEKKTGDSASNDRPHAFASESSQPKPSMPTSKSTFHDLLPAHGITSASLAEAAQTGTPKTGEAQVPAWLRKSVRRVTLPSIGNSIRRSTRRSATVGKPEDHKNNASRNELNGGDTRSAMAAGRKEGSRK
ncbi:hypothetical protein DFH06DRAFT_1171680 [Mycena polygramma]|nr:hypothetical protein DFH06DRAFT_1171680 [Mycena polygramma]